MEKKLKERIDGWLGTGKHYPGQMDERKHGRRGGVSQGEIITVYRGYTGSEPLQTRMGMVFYSDNKDYASKYGDKLYQKKIDLSKFLDPRTKSGAKDFEAIQEYSRRYDDTIYLDPAKNVPFYSDAKSLKRIVKTLFGDKYAGLILSEQTSMGSGGISYAEFVE